MGGGVELSHFTLPREGMWCLRLNGAEQTCVGDGNVVEADVALSAEACAGRFIELQAVLRAGLESPVVVRESEVLRISVT
mmetsp:Transcript_56001/g.154342  ORF Transcript_56001/g.154342 Transcript_56001/m.154342 type:complete len:80 (+) Transcript_56001:1-240(+)